MLRRISILSPLALALFGALTACTHPKPAYLGERFDPQSPYQHYVPALQAAACEAGRRALLSQGYVIEESKPDAVQASKSFQPEVDRHTKLNFSLVCLPAGGGTVIYVNAREMQYALKAGASSAGLSVAGVGSISLPWGSTNENLVKVGEETVSDPGFYTRFFALMDLEID
jgi:hypothetical protein